MINADVGFYIESLEVRGVAKENATLIFSDGLNVISGASNTGKSYVLACIDFALGASKPPEQIPESSGYTWVILEVVVRSTKQRVSIERSFDGNTVRLKIFDLNRQLISESTVPVKHDSKNDNTLSSILLKYCSLWKREVVKNSRGETRTAQLSRFGIPLYNPGRKNNCEISTSNFWSSS